MAKALEARRNRGGFFGIKSLSNRDGLWVLEKLMGKDSSAQVVVLPVDWRAVGKKLSGEKVPAKMRDLLVQGGYSAKAKDAGEDVIGALQALASEEQRVAYLAEFLQREIKKVLGTSESIPNDKSMMDLGFDSLMAVELRNRLTAVVGTSLPSTLIFD